MQPYKSFFKKIFKINKYGLYLSIYLSIHPSSLSLSITKILLSLPTNLTKARFINNILSVFFKYLPTKQTKARFINNILSVTAQVSHSSHCLHSPEITIILSSIFNTPLFFFHVVALHYTLHKNHIFILVTLDTIINTSCYLFSFETFLAKHYNAKLHHLVALKAIFKVTSIL